jgi:UDP-N-acetylglucosamine--N-acetylmuramyl-(pentapeptide) pyrophosphoryl-undecaprenol N-acetylglucosamine transferase
MIYVGLAGGVEERAVPAANIPLILLRLTTPDTLRKQVRFAVDVVRAVARCLVLFGKPRPDVVFSTGGFVSLPATVAAWLRRIPVTIYLPDAHPGRAIQVSRRLATTVAVTSQEAAAALHAPDAAVTGYPVRAAFRNVSREDARASAGLLSDDLQILVTGGSQGSLAINTAVQQMLPALLSRARIIHVCGPDHVAACTAAALSLPEGMRRQYRVVGSLDGPSMAEAMMASDLAITRAGASILGELPAAALPAVLVPLPINAQDQNAAVLSRRNAAVVVPQERMADELEPVVLGLLDDGERRARMVEALRALDRPDAALAIARLIVETASRAA